MLSVTIFNTVQYTWYSSFINWKTDLYSICCQCMKFQWTIFHFNATSLLHLLFSCVSIIFFDFRCINFEPLWGDFFGARGIAQNRPVPFLDTFPLKIWFHMNPPSGPFETSFNAEINALLHISTLISVQLNHYQFLFLLKLADEFTEVTHFTIILLTKI